MKFAEKLARLTRGKNKQLIGLEAGLAKTTISDYIAKGSSPKADKALALARVLKVPVEWLIDDQQDFPIPEQGKALSPLTLTDNQLMQELVRRRRIAQILFAEAMDAVENANWDEVRARLAAIPVGQPLPADLMNLALAVHNRMAVGFELAMQFNLSTQEDMLRKQLPDGGRKPEDISLKVLWDRNNKMAADRETGKIREALLARARELASVRSP